MSSENPLKPYFKQKGFLVSWFRVNTSTLAPCASFALSKNFPCVDMVQL